MPGTYTIRFRGINRDFTVGKVQTISKDRTWWWYDSVYSDHGKMVIDAVPDTTAPVYEAAQWLQDDGEIYTPGTWTDKNVSLTLKNIEDFTKGGNYTTTFDDVPCVVDQEGNEISGLETIEVKDTNGNSYPIIKDNDGNDVINLEIEEGQQLTATLQVIMTDKKGNTVTKTLDPVKISKSAVQVEVGAQKDNEETPTILGGGIGDGYSFFAKNRARFEIKATMSDQTMYVQTLQYQFVKAGEVINEANWQTTEFSDHQNPHSIVASKNEAFDGAIWIRALGSNGKTSELKYNLMVEDYPPT
ncbi:MAG: hypothetical protein RR614_15490, partial [Eubacterium sp.]